MILSIVPTYLDTKKKHGTRYYSYHYNIYANKYNVINAIPTQIKLKAN